MNRPLWIVCAGACVGLTLGIRQALGLFLTPISLDTGMGREVFALSLGLANLFGLVFFGHQIGSFPGAWLAGHFYDLSGNYDAVWWLCVAIGLISAALHWPIAGRPVARVAEAAS